jgi:ABC-type Fe3+-hydroxamate transport system substrate-binding protein
MPVLRLLPRRSTVLTLAALTGVACSREQQAPQGVARDDFGAAIQFTPTPSRVVSLNPATTEIVFAIGAGNRLVGRSHWDSWPDSARFVADLGPALRPTVEAILNVHPDLVLLFASDDDRPAASRLTTLGIRTVALRDDRIDQFRRTTVLLGRLLNHEDRAKALVDSIDGTLARVRAATASLSRPKVFLHIWEKPLITIGKDSFLNELIDIAGGVNIYGTTPGPSPVVTLEDVVRRDPDLILVSPTTAAELRASPAWQAVRAVREGHVLAYDTTLVGRPSVTLGMAAVNLAGLLHPGSVKP